MIEVLGVPFSAHTRKVLVLLEEKQLDYQLTPLIPLDPPAGFDRDSPLRKIPILRHDGVTLADSSVIALYLERCFAERPMFPTDPAEYGRALWIEEYVDGALASHVLHGLLMQRVFAPRFLGRDPDQALIEQSLEREIPPRLAYLEDALGEAKWFAGTQFSYADVAVASILVNYHYAGERLTADAHPKLFQFLRRALGRPAFARHLQKELPAARRVEGLDLSLLEELGYGS